MYICIILTSKRFLLNLCNLSGRSCSAVLWIRIAGLDLVPSLSRIFYVMCSNPLENVPRLVSYKPNDCLQITFHNECSKRKMYKNDLNRRRTTHQNGRSEFKPNESNFMCKNINHTNNNVSYFKRSVDNWQRQSPSVCHNSDQPFSSRAVNVYPSNNTSRFSNVTETFGVHHRGAPPLHQQQQQPKQPPAYRRSGQLTSPGTTNTTTSSYHYADANDSRGQTSAAASRHRPLPLSHPPRFSEEPYRDYQQPSGLGSAGVFRAPRRAPPATTPPDIHQPPPSVLFKQRQRQRASCQGNATAVSDTQSGMPRHQPPTPAAQQQRQRQQRQGKNDWTGEVPAVNGVVGGQNSGFQRHNQMVNVSRHYDHVYPERAEFNPQRGRFSMSSRRFGGPKIKQGRGNNHHPGCYDYEAGERKGDLTRRKHGPPSPPPPFSDEYIDDFTPEDLVKYNLQIDMENFTVQSPLISDPILNVPLSTTWLTDDLYQTVTASSLEQNHSPFAWHKPDNATQDWTCADECVSVDNPAPLHIDSAGRKNGSVARTQSLHFVAHSSRIIYDRINSCPGTLDSNPGHGEVDGHRAHPDALGSTTSLPGSLSVYQQEHRLPLFQSRSCPANLHLY